ncbi:PREDICTED: C-C motif chemokine 25 [Rhinopithecus bieti]|uniref:C-C motif chemokine 25 n=1 Tax=Rhinopithecus bieti TaxID=61621 RepID=UPI00083BBF3C|nr:PREDICTED: C-C motif chemokine 25 [Rhinopithecus bieti]
MWKGWKSLAYSLAGISSLDPVDIGAQGGGPTRSMNLWLLACLVAGFLGAWAPTVHTQGTVFGNAYPQVPISPCPHPTPFVSYLFQKSPQLHLH